MDADEYAVWVRPISNKVGRWRREARGALDYCEDCRDEWSAEGTSVVVLKHGEIPDERQRRRTR